MSNQQDYARHLFGDDEVPPVIKKIFPGAVVVPLTKEDVIRIAKDKRIKKQKK